MKIIDGTVTTIDSPGEKTITCNSISGTPINITYTPDHPAGATVIKGTTYPASDVVASTLIVYPSDFNTTHPSCSNVTVLKYKTPGRIKTKIESRGYNTCPWNLDGTPKLALDPQRVERGLEVFY